MLSEGNISLQWSTFLMLNIHVLRGYFNTIVHHLLETLNFSLSFNDLSHSLLNDACNFRLLVVLSDWGEFLFAWWMQQIRWTHQRIILMSSDVRQRRSIFIFKMSSLFRWVWPRSLNHSVNMLRLSLVRHCLISNICSFESLGRNNLWLTHTNRLHLHDSACWFDNSVIKCFNDWGLLSEVIKTWPAVGWSLSTLCMGVNVNWVQRQRVLQQERLGWRMNNHRLLGHLAVRWSGARNDCLIDPRRLMVGIHAGLTQVTIGFHCWWATVWVMRCMRYQV